MKKLTQQSTDLFERSRGVLAELGGSDLLGGGEDSGHLERLFACAHFLTVREYVGSKL